MAFRLILVASDFQECSNAALEHAIDLAKRCGARLTVVHAFEVPYGGDSPYVAELARTLQGDAEAQLRRLIELVGVRVPGATGIVRCGPAWQQILDVAQEQGADLIVVGSHGRKGLPRALLGSVAEKVVRLSPVPVLTVHGPSPGG